MKKIILFMLMVFTVFEAFTQDTSTTKQSPLDLKREHNKSQLATKQKKYEKVYVDMPDWIAEDYAKIFSNLGFSSIKKIARNKNVMRLCFEKIDPVYYVIELTWSDSSAFIIFVEGNEIEKKIVKKNKLKVKKQDIQKIVEFIDKSDFFNQPCYISTNERDGETWYVEANIGGSYKSVSRRSPRETFLEDFGYTLFDLINEDL